MKSHWVILCLIKHKFSCKMHFILTLSLRISRPLVHFDLYWTMWNQQNLGTEKSFKLDAIYIDFFYLMYLLEVCNDRNICCFYLFNVMKWRSKIDVLLCIWRPLRREARKYIVSKTYGNQLSAAIWFSKKIKLVDKPIKL